MFDHFNTRLKQFLTTFLFILFLAGSVDAAPQSTSGAKAKLGTLLSNIYRGTHYLGGKRPKIIKIDPRGTFHYDGTNYVRQVKADVLRSGFDRNGKAVIYAPKTWAAAFKRITGWQPGLEADWIFRLFLPRYRKPFPAIKAEFLYSIFLEDSQGNYVGYVDSKDNPIRKKAKGKRYVQDLPMMLKPGVYEATLDAKVSLMDHPAESLMEIKGWFGFLMDLKNRNLPTLWGVTKSTALWLIKKGLTETEMKYRLVVKAKTPKLIGERTYSSEWELKKWGLRQLVKKTKECHARQAGKIVKQRPAFQALADPRYQVKVWVCNREAEDPTPTPTPSYCVESITPDILELDAIYGSVEIAVKTVNNSDCIWTAKKDDSTWYTLHDQFGRKGNGKFIVQYAEYTGSKSRSGTIQIDKITLPIEQNTSGFPGTWKFYQNYDDSDYTSEHILKLYSSKKFNLSFSLVHTGGNWSYEDTEINFAYNATYDGVTKLCPYKGTLTSENTMAGTMIGYYGTTGVWHAERVE